MIQEKVNLPLKKDSSCFTNKVNYVIIIIMKRVNMAKNHQSDNPLFKALVKKYESDIASTFATLIVYFDSSVKHK